jgi:hypothetical protein
MNVAARRLARRRETHAQQLRDEIAWRTAEPR